MRLRVGKSRESGPQSRRAVREALGEANPDGSTASVLVFSSDHYDVDQLASELNAELKGIPWAGCCTSLVIAGGELITHGLAVGALQAEPGEHVGIGVAGPVSVNPRDAGRRAAAQALEHLPSLSPDRHRGMILLTEATRGNPTEVVRGAALEAGAGLAWAGGGAGDNFHHTSTAEFADGVVHRDSVVAIAIDSTSELGTGVSHGWRAYGPPLMVTRARGSTVLKLDYDNAFLVYSHTAENVGDRVSREDFSTFAMRHPLGIPQPAAPDLIRDPVALESDGGISCVAEVPEGTLVRVMVGGDADLLAASRQAAEAAAHALSRPPQGALIFDCFSRFLSLSTSINEELSGIQQGLGAGVPMLGCLTLGEVAALNGGVPQFHNKTTVVMTL